MKKKLDALKIETPTPEEVTHSIYGEIKIGDTIQWCGDYFDGWNEDGSYKTKYLSGTNTVSKLFKEPGCSMMELDNGKQFAIRLFRRNIDGPDDWKKLNT